MYPIFSSMLPTCFPIGPVMTSYAMLRDSKSKRALGPMGIIILVLTQNMAGGSLT